MRSAMMGAAVLIATSTVAMAADQHLEFKLVTHPLEATVLQAPNLEGQSISDVKAFGVAFFTDGRIATKDFVISSDTHSGAGPLHSFSTYTFTDGSSITAKFVGEADYKAGKIHGEYTIISGTGIYANATGTGSFDSLPAKFSKGTYLLAGKFDIKTAIN
jgi:hypothetical protein